MTSTAGLIQGVSKEKIQASSELFEVYQQLKKVFEKEEGKTIVEKGGLPE